MTDQLTGQLNSARQQVFDWMREERSAYANHKYDIEAQMGWHDEDEATLSEDGRWWPFIGNYVQRARLFSLKTPQGRQALGKVITTLQDCLAAAVVKYGPMPEPGHPSGEIRDWDYEPAIG